ncbi:phage terminase large subunit [Methylovorus sp. MM2]|uniref:phage terminase large subunit n=1 Tax=Methylovorus sp. MM2 TaxID=1848038 RepID=UPI00210FF469|nr:phage terminase large subunit [Methylovorus sp. MM2]
MDPVKADFRNFLYLVWKHLNLPDPTPIQYDIAHYLQHAPKRCVIEAFRGVGKSWITSAFVCWLLLRDPQTKILVVSASKGRSDDFSSFTKRLIADMPELQHLIPKDGQRDSMVAFDVAPALNSHAPSVKSLGITGQLTGSRADVIIADDIEVANNSLTQMLRDKLSQSIKEFDALLTTKPEARIIYLGTPQTEMSVYNSLPERGYEVRIWTARFPNPSQIEKYMGRVAPYITDALDRDPALAGKTSDPKRFTDIDLMEREASYGRSGFALQFMMDTSLSDADRYPLKLIDLLIFDIDRDVAPVKLTWAGSPEYTIPTLPSVGFIGDRYQRPMFSSKEFTDFQGSVMSIDPSGRGADETGYAVVKMLNGMLYCPVASGFKGGYDDETLKSLALVAKNQKVNLIIIESNFGDGMFTKLFTPWLAKVGYTCTTIEERSVGQKERRIIDTLEPVLNQHRLVVSENVAKEDLKTEDPRYQLMFQLTRITKDRGSLVKDDRLDALAIAVKYWVEQMDKDTSTSLDEYKTRMLEEELERFADTVFGHSDHSLTWANA